MAKLSARECIDLLKKGDPVGKNAVKDIVEHLELLETVLPQIARFSILKKKRDEAFNAYQMSIAEYDRATWDIFEAGRIKC